MSYTNRYLIHEGRIIIFLLLALVAVDATGDAFRLTGRMVLHHSMEVALIFGFFLLWKVSRFRWVYVLLYILARIWLFDIILNLWAGNSLLYMGTTDLVGQSVRWFADVVGQNYMHFSFILKLMSFVAWVGFIIKYWWIK